MTGEEIKEALIGKRLIGGSERVNHDGIISDVVISPHTEMIYVEFDNDKCNFTNFYPHEIEKLIKCGKCEDKDKGLCYRLRSVQEAGESDREWLGLEDVCIDIMEKAKPLEKYIGVVREKVIALMDNPCDYIKLSFEKRLKGTFSMTTNNGDYTVLRKEKNDDGSGESERYCVLLGDDEIIIKKSED